MLPGFAASKSSEEEECHLHLASCFTAGPAPTRSSFLTLHDPRVIANFLNECCAHRSVLLEGTLGVQH